MDDQGTIHCHTHGDRPPCMICCHLFRGAKGRGFNAAQEPDPDADPEYAHWREAWCDRCDRWWGRNAVVTFFYNLVTPRPRLVCEGCMDAIRVDNEHPGREPGWWER